MNQINRTLRTALAMGICVLALSTQAQAEGWQMPNLNPFSGTKAQKLPSDPKYKSSSKSWLPSWKTKPSSGPSVWQKTKSAPGDMVRGTQNAMSAVNPFKPAAKTSSSNHYTSGNAGKPPESKSWMPSWGGTEADKQPARPQTVSDWIALPRAE